MTDNNIANERLDERRRNVLKAAAALAGVAAFGGMPSAWGAPAEAPAVDTDTLVIGLDKGFVNLNGVVAGTGDSDRYTLQVFDRLYGFDAQGTLQPSLATAYEIAADGLSYTYRLRPGVKFHHGGVVSADDVKFTMEFALDPANKSARRAFFAPYVERVDVLDAGTVCFRLRKPDGAFHNKLAGYLPIIPRNYGSPLPALEFFARSPVSAGAYRVVKLSADGNLLELERFEDYWGPKPAIKRIVFRAIKDASNRVNALLAGEIDLIVGVPAQDFARLNATDNFVAVANPVAAPLFVRPYTSDPQLPLANVQVRQALNYALDKDAIIKTVLQGIGEPLASGISRYYPYGADATLEPYPYSPAKARELLAAAGFAKGFTTKLLISSDNPKEVAEAVAAYWSQVGVQAQIQVVDYATWVLWNDTRRTTPMTVQQVANAIYDPSHPVGGLFVKAGAWSDYSHPEVEALFAEASHTADSAGRGALFQRISRILHDDAAAIFISEIHRVYGRKKNLQWAPTRGTAALRLNEARWV
ncbi:ABC transporter substrate-binding protein [Pseudomonas typographi]|uniref:ABC transporter substrate-binding protein n=1 Tax=Pseudomonas typographi TaxID=2715964 RepID=A0ABR7Z1V7_9PSED|nr:ABC transporter substrate-binding protein [Pseudomonas typographi]MBD1551484.1 ABC transporter substrate-binding protein [Pseudomonas typographi]MBD1587530.1 ABC transporter substrate-binding protein [Pseudomonas typographi]MBD1599387.1 ABC transporter substrate-binding protein [Pseudomonas typographi]